MWLQGPLQGLTWPRMSGGWLKRASRWLQDGLAWPRDSTMEVAIILLQWMALGMPPWLPSQAPESLNMSPKWRQDGHLQPNLAHPCAILDSTCIISVTS